MPSPGQPFDEFLDEFVAAAGFHAEAPRELDLGQVEDADHHVRHLHTGVVDVILYLDARTEVAEAPPENVSEDRISEVADMGRLVGVDGSVLDYRLVGCRVDVAVTVCEKGGQDQISFQKEVEKTGTSDLDPIHLLRPDRVLGDRLGDLPRRLAQDLGQGQGAGPGEVAQIAPRRHFELHLIRPVLNSASRAAATASAARFLIDCRGIGFLHSWKRDSTAFRSGTPHVDSSA